MPRISKLSRSTAVYDATIASLSVLDFLAPAAFEFISHARPISRRRNGRQRPYLPDDSPSTDDVFYAALSRVSLCDAHRPACTSRSVPDNISNTSNYENSKDMMPCRRYSNFKPGGELRPSEASVAYHLQQGTHMAEQPITKPCTNFSRLNGPQDMHVYPNSEACLQQLRPSLKNASMRLPINYVPVLKERHSSIKSKSGSLSICARQYHTDGADSQSKRRSFAESSRLPSTFFDDVSALKNSTQVRQKSERRSQGFQLSTTTREKVCDANKSPNRKARPPLTKSDRNSSIGEQMKLLSSVRELEARLEKARKELAVSMAEELNDQKPQATAEAVQEQLPLVLSKEDYMNLVDLYYYSHNSRFSPESTDNSPTPLFLDDYSFTLSSDFSPNQSQEPVLNEEETYKSPLRQIEEMLKQHQLREVAAMQVFVDLLLDDHSSNRALFEAYQHLPEPGVAYLPKGIVRLLLQRMSTPWTVSEKSMLRYLALIDDMQKAQIPITVAEWSSAIYLAGRAFNRVTSEEVSSSFKMWQTMEREAGVSASHVTFNILFDIAVRSGRFALGETILKEMHSRNLRLNRLGRVSLMYYHGLRKDGDGVRKVYRDFVDAGEIVDTLVLNCVIASLLNAQEPQAAEQVYARMKNMHLRLKKGYSQDGGEDLYQRYPDPGTNTIGKEMASNHLGRILEKAPRLHRILPEHHQQLQAQMPLTPDHVTFRSLVAYHATVSGDLDRLTVLLNEMTELFQLPLRTITFQLLFKGFAIHGPVGGPHSSWSVKRLDLCWNACRSAIKASESSQTAKQDLPSGRSSSVAETSSDEDKPQLNPILASITQINAISSDADLSDFRPFLSRPPPRRLSDWSEFVLDLAAFPRERLKRLERFHATMFDAEDEKQPHEQPGVHTFSSPFFQSTAYTAPEPKLDTEEGEYELPNPSGPGLLHNAATGLELDSGVDGSVKASPETEHQVTATRTLVCWLLRAYARVSKSRIKVEEVWGQIRKIYKPRDANDRESVVRVLRRCLRDCDREGSG